MKRVMVCLGLLLTCALPCAAQKATGSSADVPPNSWPFVAQDTIKGAGISFGYPDGTYGGRRATTRYEFAVATARALEMAMPPSWSEHATLRTDVPIKLQASPLAVSALIALANEFRPELNRMEPNALKETARLIALQKQQRQEIQDGKIVLTPEQLKSPFADVSRTDPTRHNENTLLKSGIVMGSTDGIGTGYLETRLQMALLIARLVAQMPPLSDLANRIQQSPQGCLALRALVTDFTPELKLLGQNADTYQAKLTELKRTAPHPLMVKPFPDVPAGHWAASSVETLRQQGIIAGYPNGAYTAQH